MEGIVAAVRCRPIKESEKTAGCKNAVEVNPLKREVIVSGERAFKFNHVFSHESTQDQIYSDLVEPVVAKVIEGYNGCIMAYGQTGSGKTYTMGTQAKSATSGLVQRALNMFFANGSLQIHISFLEVYKEKFLDLLSSSKNEIYVQEFKPVGLTLIEVKNIESALAVIEKGLGNRHVGATNANLHSSRSHAVFTIHVSATSKGCHNTSKLYLVDLAGSESAAEQLGNARQEGVMINKGLLQLGNVMSALSTAGQDHIPYRNSALTSILKDTLSLQNYIVLIACISPLDSDTMTTISSLQFATRVGKIKCNPEAGRVIRQVPLTTPFKIPPHRKNANSTIAITTPGSRGKIRPALKPLNNTFDSPRTPLVRQGKKQFWPTSTPFQTGSEPSFAGPTPILGKRRSSSEWNAMNVSSSTDILDSTVAQVKAQATIQNITSIIPNSENEKWLRSIIADVIREELKSHTFLGCSVVNNGPSPPKQPRRSARLSKSTFFEHESNVTVVSSSPNHDGSPNLAGNATVLQCTFSGSDSAQSLIISGASEAKTKSSICQSTHLSTKLSRQSQMFGEDLNMYKRSAKQKNVLRDTAPVRRSLRLSVAPSKPDESFLSASKVQKISKKAMRLTARLSSVEPEHAQEQLNNLVLNVLRHGDVKKLQSLPTIGPKTAVIISNHRLLHGPIESLKDIYNIRGLSKNFAKKFFWANNIVLDEDSDAE